MIICGVNSAQEELDQGRNQNCRVFDVDVKYVLQRSQTKG